MTFKVEMQTIFAHSPLLMKFATVVCSAIDGWLVMVCGCRSGAVLTEAKGNFAIATY